METEVWKDIVWFEGIYQASSLWNIKSCKRIASDWRLLLWKQLKFAITNSGYYFIWLCQKSNSISKTVHRLVAQAFIPNPEYKSFINHKNWIKTDNRVENLEWCTRSENEQHKYKVLWYKWNKYWLFWKNHNRSKKVNQYDLDWNFIKTWDSMSDIQRDLGINASYVCRCCKWQIKKSWWFKWRYL